MFLFKECKFFYTFVKLMPNYGLTCLAFVRLVKPDQEDVC